MKIVLTTNPIENIFSQCAVCFLPEDLRPLQGAVGRVDWALNGLIGRLITAGKVAGKFLESVLIRPGRYIATEKLLIFGMGPLSEYQQEKIEKIGERLLNVLTGLSVRDISLSFPDPPGGHAMDEIAEFFTKGFLTHDGDKDLQDFFEEVNLAVSSTEGQIDEILLGIQRAKVDLKKHFSVIVLE